MQFTKKTRSGPFSSLGKLLIKFIILIFCLFALLVLIDRIDFPSPNKKIEKVIPNEKLRLIK
tara:strand:- start:712 stop:897 length:186 start_codon:yes stop_codon:yes gene_type:complete